MANPSFHKKNVKFHRNNVKFQLNFWGLLTFLIGKMSSFNGFIFHGPLTGSAMVHETGSSNIAGWKMVAPDWRFVFPMKHGDIPASYVIVYKRVNELDKITTKKTCPTQGLPEAKAAGKTPRGLLGKAPSGIQNWIISQGKCWYP